MASICVDAKVYSRNLGTNTRRMRNGLCDSHLSELGYFYLLKIVLKSSSGASSHVPPIGYLTWIGGAS